MKLALLYFAAFVVAGVAAAPEEAKKKDFSDLLQWYANDLQELGFRLDELMLSWINPETLAEIGDDCAVGVVPVVPDPLHWLPTYYGEVRVVATCWDGLSVFGSTFHNDEGIRSHSPSDDSHVCCLHIQCGPDNTGYCANQGTGCKDLGMTPLANSNCPGSNAQCCPTIAQKSDASFGDDIDLTALGGPADTDMFSGGEISLGTPDQNIALGINPPPEGSLNLDDWTTAPLENENENLFLANDDSDNYGTIASLGGSIGDFDSTG